MATSVTRLRRRLAALGAGTSLAVGGLLVPAIPLTATVE